MPFTRKTLKPMAGISRSLQPRLYGYRTADANAAIIAVDYFAELADGVDGERNELKVGDLIFAHAGFGGTPTHHIYRVSAASATSITVVAGATL